MRKSLRISRVAVCWLLCCCWYMTDAASFTDPPVFTDPVPADTTVSCVKEVPAPVALEATDDNDPDFPMLIDPVDDPPLSSLDGCSSVTITRTWTAVDDVDNTSTVVTQTITVQADTSPPMVDLAPVQDTVSCELSKATATSNPDRYDIWISSLRLGVATRLSDDCSGIETFSDDAPGTFDENCSTLTVTFTIVDSCGLVTEWPATYTTIDTVPPALNGVPEDMQLSCSQSVPAPAVVTATDNCSESPMVTFSESSTQVFNGTCLEYEYTVTRIWSAMDECGNVTRDTQLIQFEDDLAPTFSVPANVTISCLDDPNDLNITGDITNLGDNCTPVDSIDVSFTDAVTPGSCAHSYTILRTWRARDRCNNITGRQQTITVEDDTPPQFDVPAAVTVDCTEANDLNVTGRPSNVQDDCDPSPIISFSDVITQGSCPNEYTINRSWEAIDLCGNVQIDNQMITVIDQQNPVIQSPAQDQTIGCSTNTDPDQAFADWISDMGGANATDNCTDNADLSWAAYNSGTTDPATLPDFDCALPGQIVRSRIVDFVVTDECGLRDTTTAVFKVIDDQAPVLRECPESFSVGTDPGSCEAMVELAPPVIEEDCFTDSGFESVSGSATLTSQAQPGEEGSVPVDPAIINLSLSGSLPINAAADGSLTIELMNVDGEESTEFFNVLGEDGSLIGFTEATDQQCGESTSNFSIPAARLNDWAVDGMITIRLEPNIPAGMDGRFSVNAICAPESTVSATLEFTTKQLPAITYAYRLNDAADSVVVDPVAPVAITLPAGDHTITYFATDCAGNVDSCAFVITVEDREAPEVSCPSDVVLNLTADSCDIAYTLPLPPAAIDNCGVLVDGSQVIPNDTASARLTFTFDPNLTDYVADPRTVTFTGVAANAQTDITLTLDYLGDFTGNRAQMEVYGEQNTLLGQTAVNSATCFSIGQLQLTIPAATFNQWAADGQLDILLQPLSVPVPPGVPGDGINPCGVGTVTADGQDDGLSYVFLTLDYGLLTPAYFTTGATTIPTTVMAAPGITPTIDFAFGQTEVSYIVQDLAGNPDTCSFMVTVEDPIPPEALCKPLGGLPINPSGLQVEVFDVSDVDFGSFDNCGIDTAFISPNTFTCADGGQPVTITLTVMDAAGNTSDCTTTLGITLSGPEPTYNYGLCGGDSLFLFANPPAPGPEAYTYRWYRSSNPGAVISTRQNPVISNIDPSFEDFYIVEIQGIFNGCSAENSVFVEVNPVPLQPKIEAAGTFCRTEDIELQFSGNIPNGGNNVSFHWYEGIAPNGNLLAITQATSLQLPAPHNLGSRNFYLIVEADGCTSRPSDTKTVQIVNRPIADITQTDTSVCAAEMLTLSTLVAGPTITGYRWMGPDNFTSTQQSPIIGPLTSQKAGFYYLQVERNECVSALDSVQVTVRPKPATPVITSNGPICEEATLVLTTTATGASSYHWLHDNDEFITTVPSFSIPQADPGNGGNWQVSIRRNACQSLPSQPVNAVVHPAPEAVADADPVPVCVGSSITLIGDSDISGVTYKWTGPGIQPRFAKNPVINQVSQANNGLFTLEVTTQPGCKDTATVAVQVVDGITNIDIVDDAPSCLSGPTDVRLIPSVFPVDDGSYNYTWRRAGEVFSTERIAIVPNATEADSDNYSLEITTGNGCSSGFVTYTLDLKNAPLPPGTPTSPTGSFQYCVGDEIVLRTTDYSGEGNEVTYYWVKNPGNQQIPTQMPELILSDAIVGDAGQYSVYVIIDECSSPPSPAVTVSVGTIPTVSAASNSPVCRGDNIQLMAQANQGATYNWGGPITSSLQNPSFSSLDQLMPTAEYYVIADLNGCRSDTAFVSVTIKAKPQRPSGISNSPVCISTPEAVLELQVLAASRTNGAQYTWFINSTDNPVAPPSDSSILRITNFNGFQNGAYNLFVRAGLDGCQSALSNAVAVTLNTIPNSQAFAGQDTTICSNNFQLRATAPALGSGMWTQTGGETTGLTIANPMDAVTPISGLTIDGGPYTFRWTLSNGACVGYSSDEVVIAVSSGETAIAGEDILACADEIVNLGATPVSGNSGTGMWTQPEAQELLGVTIVDRSNPSTLIEGLAPDNVYVFTWTVSNDCGVSEDRVNVIISDPTPDAGPDEIACNDQSTWQLQADVPTSGSRGHWTAKNAGATFSFPNQPVTQVSGLVEGDNVFYWTIDEGFCGEMSEDSVTIFYKLPPIVQDESYSVGFQEALEVDLLANDEVPVNTQVRIISGPDHGTLDALGDGRFVYTPDFNFVGMDVVQYEVISDGCNTLISTATFQIGSDVRCEVPNVITPNNDGVNDTFTVPCLLDEFRYPLSQVIIFNRWGDEVFRSDLPYRNTWDGRFNGQPLPADTYFYVIIFGNDEPRQTGFVRIQR